MNNIKVNLVSHTTNPEALVTTAARMCYSDQEFEEIMKSNTDDSIAKFIGKIMRAGHLSVLEHATFTFSIENISRVTEIQLLRKRTASPTVQSGRYVNRSEGSYAIPPSIFNNSRAYHIYKKQAHKAHKAYKELTDVLVEESIEEFIRHDDILLSKVISVSTVNVNLRGRSFASILKQIDEGEYNKLYKKFEKQAVEDARYIQPQSLKTRMTFTIDLRNLIELIKARKCRRAQWEAREVIYQIEKLIEPLLPNISKYIGAPCEFGHCPEGEMTCGNPIGKKMNN